MCHLARAAGSDLWPTDGRQTDVIRWLSWSAQHFTYHAGALYFAREGDRATPVRLIQIPLAPADSNTPMLLALLDEEMGPTDRGTAQTYVETLLSLLPFGLAITSFSLPVSSDVTPSTSKCA